MNGLPENWAIATLGELCEKPEYGWTTSGAGSGTLKLLRTTDISGGTVDWASVPYCDENPPDVGRYRLRPGDIVISRAGSVGFSFLVRDCPEVVFASYLIRFRPLQGIDARYMSYFLQSPDYWDEIAKSSAGIALQNVNAKKLAAISVPVAPLPEQKRIVAEIEKEFPRLDAAVAALKRVQANLKRYRATVLKAACEGRLVPTEAELARAEGRSYEPADQLLHRILADRRARWEADQLAKFRASGKESKDDKWKVKYEEPQAPDISALPPLPVGWTWVTMPQLGELNRGKSKHRPRDDPRLFGGRYPFIQTGDVKRSGGYVRIHSQTYNEAGLAQSRLWPAGTLCITIAANIAESGILTYPACFPDSVVGFRMEGHPETIRFVQFFLDTAKAELARFAPATAQKNINLETLSSLAIPVPSLAEQQRIVAEVERRVSVLDELETQVEANLKRGERLRQAILKRAFEGKLAPQEPDDEPASVLLERIRTERAKRETEERTPRKPRIRTAQANAGVQKRKVYG